MQAKDECRNEKYEDIEILRNIGRANMHKKIKEVTGQKKMIFDRMHEIQGKFIIVEERKVLLSESRKECIGQFFRDNSEEKPKIHKNMCGHEVLKK